MHWPGLDYHNHVCGAPIAAMLASAHARGVREFAITEHIFMLFEGQHLFPNQEEDGERSALSEYVNAIRDHGRSDQPLVRLGLEVDYIPGTEDAVTALLESTEWDVLLGSIHEIDDIDLHMYTPQSREEGERLWWRYYELHAEAIESGLFDVITHPMRNAVLNSFVPANLDQCLDELAAFAKFHGVALELNGYDTTHFPHLVERLAAACGRTGCVVSFGSDAHAPEDVGRGLERAAAFAHAAGVRSALTVERRDRRLVPL